MGTAHRDTYDARYPNPAPYPMQLSDTVDISNWKHMHTLFEITQASYRRPRFSDPPAKFHERVTSLRLAEKANFFNTAPNLVRFLFEDARQDFAMTSVSRPFDQSLFLLGTNSNKSRIGPRSYCFGSQTRPILLLWRLCPGHDKDAFYGSGDRYNSNRHH